MTTTQNGNKRDKGNDVDLFSLPMDLTMLAFSLNKIMSKLLFIRIDRTKIMAETAQAMLDENPEEIHSQLARMYSGDTKTQEWKKLEEIKKEIADMLKENMDKFEAANAALKKAGKKEIDPADLRLPEKRFAEIQASTDQENIYDKFQEYNELLNDFLTKTAALCNELGMTLVRI